MLELIDLDKKISKADYKARLPSLQSRLLEIQRACWRGRIASILVFEGWDAAGKGPCIRKLTERLEPRGFDLYYLTDKPRTYELEMPWMWRFWLQIPSYGKMAIFDRSWNRRILVERVEAGAGELRWRRALRDIGDFERQLADDGTVFVKLFLHIAKSDQEKRYEAWKKDPGLSWKALEGDWQKPTHYEAHLAAAEELLQHTEAPWAPWTIVPATDQRWARLAVFETVIGRLEEALAARGLELPAATGEPSEDDDDVGDAGENGDSGESGENGDGED